MADGSVIFSTELDNEPLEAGLADIKKEIADSEKQLEDAQKRTNKAIEKRGKLYADLEKSRNRLADAEKKLADQQAAQSPLIARAEELQGKMAREKALADQYRDDELSGRRGADRDRMAALEQLAATKEQYGGVLAEIEKIDAKIEKATADVEQQKSAVASTQAEWINAGNEVGRLKTETEAIAQKISDLKDNAGELTRKIEEVGAGSSRMGDAVKMAGTHMDKFLDRVRRLAGRVFVFSVITRALRELIGWLWKVIQTDDEAARAFGQLKGALLTLAQPLVNVIIPAFTFLVNLLAQIITAISKLFAKLFGYSYSDTKKQAQALNKEAAAIGGVGNAAKEASKYLAGFDELNTLPEETTDFGGGGAGGLGDLTAPNFEDPGVVDYLDNLLYLIGAIGAGLLAWRIASAFTDDLNLAAGLGLAVGGGLLFAFNWADAFANSIDWTNLGGMLAGLIVLAGGLALAFGPVAAAIGLLAGGIALVVLGMYEWITTGELSNAACTAIVAGIAAIGGAIALFTGSWIPLAIAAVVGFVFACATKGDEIKAVLQKLDDWLQGIFTKDWTEVFGPVLGGVLNGFLDKVSVVWNAVKQMLNGLIDFIQGVFTGSWAQAWEGLKNIAKGAVNGVIGVINSMIASVINGVNALFRLLSFHINLPGGGSFGLNLPQITPPQIPYLAKGAVIPPNREFMAVLGDQTHGNNIEAPEDLIRKIVREETAGGAGNGEIIALLQELIEAVLGIRVGDEVIGRAAQRYARRSERARGW